MSTPSAPTPERQVEEDLVRLDAYRNQLNGLVQQRQILLASRQDHARARESLEGIDRADTTTEYLVPLGGEAFVRGKVERGSPVLLGVGSGVVVEMERPKVAELLAQRLGRLDQAVRELEGQIASLDERVQLVSRRLDAASRSAGDGGDVGVAQG
ncbi:MAG TPA: prefoldin subunit alpha [Thermoplasmata archaeon]|nr:prefoldin subunit alpha [Thermoplasmata archaeon]